MTHYILIGCVTCPDVADVYTSIEGRRIRVGDPEFRVVADLADYSDSEDFASMKALREVYPDAILPDAEIEALVRKPTSERRFTITMSSDTCANDHLHAIEMFLVQLSSGDVYVRVEEDGGEIHGFDAVPGPELNQFLNRDREEI